MSLAKVRTPGCVPLPVATKQFFPPDAARELAVFCNYPAQFREHCQGQPRSLAEPRRGRVPGARGEQAQPG
eukprot:8339378-Lingulodinium_polyedra.AAC.1